MGSGNQLGQVKPINGTVDIFEFALTEEGEEEEEEEPEEGTPGCLLLPLDLLGGQQQQQQSSPNELCCAVPGMMGDKPLWEQIGSSFVQHYYQLFDTDRTQLGSIYIDASCLTWEGQQFQGKRAIVEKLSSLPFTKIAHSITAQDHQPTPDSCILSMVVGQLKADDDPIMGFHQSFILKKY
ncbi:hypothetical protein CRUP_018278 [Coryphaenoides rupestris]|nr:hypothetical protein CRUP_018278 [Coryphaenoides rupestris]